MAYPKDSGTAPTPLVRHCKSMIIGRTTYEAFCERQGINPTWWRLTSEVQDAWVEAAEAAREAL